MSKTKRIALLVIAGFGYQALMGTGWLIATYYSLFQGGMGFTDTQMGVLMSIIGTVAVIGYLVSGIISDIFSPKFLMILSYCGVAVALFFMLSFPSYEIMIILQVVVALCAILTYWGAMAKFVRTLGTGDEEGRMYGLFYAFVGIGATLTGLITTRFVAKFDSNAAGLKALLMIYAVTLVVVAILQMILYKNQKSEKTAEEDRFQLKYVLDVLKIPELWLISIMGFAGYLTYLSMAYFAPLLSTSFGVSAAMITLISVFRAHVVRLIVAPTTGIIIDKIQSSTKVMLYALITAIVFIALIIVVPSVPKYTVFAIIALFVLAIIYNISTPCWFTPISEIGIPNKMKGTAVGIYSAIMFSSDAFAYTIAGRYLDKYGEAGYTWIYGTVIGVMLIGVACIIIVRKRLAAKSSVSE